MSDVTDAARAHFAAWRTELAQDAVSADPHLVDLLTAYGHGGRLPGLTAFAERCVADLDALAVTTNEPANLPRLERYDAHGRRVERIVFHPGYHQLGRAIYGTGLMALYRQPGQEMATLATMYLVSQLGEAGHACPLACTAGLIKILQRSPDAPPSWLERLFDPDYDTHFHGSQFLTEVQGGSDVGANAVTAVQHEDGTWRLHGEKWFCSVIDAQLFLVTARPVAGPDGTRGLMAFVVPRVLEDGTTNDFHVRRLKDKLGTRSMASAEVDFVGAQAVPVGDFRDVVSVVLNTSRLYNAVAACGLMQRAAREAHGYARHRHAFGAPILQFPAVARIVARLHAEAYGARAVTFRLSALSDRLQRGDGDTLDEVAWRALVNLNKYWTAVRATSCVRDAIEVLGGNGAIESFSVLPRLLRDSVVIEAWEGGHNVLCAQVLRDCQRLGLHEGLFAWLRRELGPNPDLDACAARWQRVLGRPDAALHLRDAVDQLGPVVQVGLLRLGQGKDPHRAVAAEHLHALHVARLDPLDDPGLAQRLQALTA